MILFARAEVIRLHALRIFVENHCSLLNSSLALLQHLSLHRQINTPNCTLRLTSTPCANRSIMMVLIQPPIENILKNPKTHSLEEGSSARLKHYLRPPTRTGDFITCKAYNFEILFEGFEAYNLNSPGKECSLHTVNPHPR